uniref:Uncharacterized protein n=1 Tax=Geospiza parvula TaxID=87175 RepID=A0A8C3NKN7_GEOPR
MLEDDITPCLVGVATASGLPLFCRPPRPQLPFSLVGALHGVQLFGAAGAELREAATPTAHLAWAGYGNSLTLVALSPSPGPAGPALTRILQSALGTLVLVLGQEELLPVRNVERLKRDLRVNWDGLGWTGNELGGTGGDWEGLGWTGRDWEGLGMGLGGTGRDWGGTGNELGGTGRDWDGLGWTGNELGGTGRDWEGLGWTG